MAANLVSLVMQFLTPDTIQRIASMLGVDRNSAQTAVGAAVPSLLAGFSSLAAQPGGGQKLVDAVTQADTPEGLADMFRGGDHASLIDSGSQMLSSLLGNRDQNALTGAISKFAGIGQGGVRSLLGVLTPLVLGTIGQQFGTRLDPGRLASALAGQKDNIAAALPSGMRNQLAGTGLLDSLTGAARTATAAGRDAVGDMTRRAVGTTSPSYNWLYWLLPLAAAAALLFYFARPSEQVAQQQRPPEPQQTQQPQQPPPTQQAQQPQPQQQQQQAGGTVGQGVATGAPDINKQITDISKQITDSVAGLHTTLGGVTDAASAQAAVPKLREATSQIEKISTLSGQLSAEQRKAVGAVVNPLMPSLNQLFDKVLAVPGVSEELGPTIDALKAKLATLAA